MQPSTQNDVNLFERTREVMTDLIAIRTHELEEEHARAHPDAEHIAQLKQEIYRISNEELALRTYDHAKVERLCAEYRATTDAWRTKHLRTRD